MTETVRDLFGDLLGEFAPRSPRIRPVQGGVNTGFSPVSPLSPRTPPETNLAATDKTAKNPDPFDKENVIEYIEQRAAILEFEAGMPRDEAEQEAVRRAVLKFRLIENQGGGTVIGAQGETLEDLLNDLKHRYVNRLAQPGDE
ncbi:MAG: hypothetical protein L0Y39_01900 [Methylococcaceae bacterium]|nr:hypothetical protein [Methylococcaceae bacterium]